MSRWIIEGLRIGKKTTGYPARPETAAGVSPGLPESVAGRSTATQAAAAVCPTGAWVSQDDTNQGHFDANRCVHCMRCGRNGDASVRWSDGFQWAGWGASGEQTASSLPAALGRSLHLRVVDAGACGACLHELALLGKPHYNMHRLGFFVTPTPRKADVLVVVGPVTDHMRAPLEEAFASMPEPRRVVAVGACAASGGVFGPSYASAGGVSEVLAVDVVVPGCPPPPLAILHALLMVAGRAAVVPDPHDHVRDGQSTP